MFMLLVILVVAAGGAGILYLYVRSVVGISWRHVQYIQRSGMSYMSHHHQGCARGCDVTRLDNPIPCHVCRPPPVVRRHVREYVMCWTIAQAWLKKIAVYRPLSAVDDSTKGRSQAVTKGY